MCVRHTSADAYCWGFNIVVPKDATDSFTEEDYNIGIKYLKEVYGAEITTVDELTASFTKE
jgi:nicotinamidase-related amidase